MDARLTQAFLAQRSAASNAVAGALAPKATAKSAAATSAKSTSSTSATDASSTITSSDFLTLLVSELQNQDPTQPTDPNEYITQLAQVNSLEQLISINSGIQQLDSSVPSTSTSTSTASSSGTSGHNVNGLVTGASAQPATAASHPVFTPALTTSVASQIHKPSHGVAAQ